jgi:hypothetical protein
MSKRQAFFLKKQEIIQELVISQQFNNDSYTAKPKGHCLCFAQTVTLHFSDS